MREGIIFVDIFLYLKHTGLDEKTRKIVKYALLNHNWHFLTFKLAAPHHKRNLFLNVFRRNRGGDRVIEYLI